MINKELSKKMISAISAIKTSCFSFELNHEESDALITQLQFENKSLRKLLSIQNQSNCKKEVEEILKSEELFIRNKENFIRSRSMQFFNSSVQHFKKEDTKFKRKGKKSQDTKGLIKESIRRNRRKSKRKRSESFDYSLYVPPQRLDESDSDSDDDNKAATFYNTNDNNSWNTFGNNGYKMTTRQTIISSSDWNSVEEIKEDQNEDQVTNNKGNSDFSGFSGYSMKSSKDRQRNCDENGETSPAFKVGYKMVMK